MYEALSYAQVYHEGIICLQTGNDPQIWPQMILEVDCKWSRRKTRNGMEFVLGTRFLYFNLLNKNKS